MFTNLITECIERHAPLKRTKITRPPAPWLHEKEIKSLQNQRDLLRHKAHSLKTPDIWQAFRDVRNRLKTKIKEAKRLFINTALSSSKPKAVWRVIYRILNPSPQPLRLDVNELNTYFAETAQRTTGNSDVDIKEDLLDFVDSLPPGSTEEEPFTLRHNEVLNEIKIIRSDTSTGPDQIPIKYLKPVAESIAGPLTHILNSFIAQSLFPNAWKVARITPIPKTNASVSVPNMRPISILPVLSKVYERLVHHQVIDYIESRTLFKDNISGFRKGHSTTTVLLGIRDDIVRAMKRGEVTLMVLADFSKAFDTIKYKTVLKKLGLLGFSKDYLKWTIHSGAGRTIIGGANIHISLLTDCKNNRFQKKLITQNTNILIFAPPIIDLPAPLTIQYLTGRKHFVQIDDNKSEPCTVNFGVPQGSIMGPLIFNLYVTDLQSCMDNIKCHQYADDTTFYKHCKPVDLQSTVTELSAGMGKLEVWSREANLVINPEKTEVMLLSTSQLSKVHHLDIANIDIAANNTSLKRVPTTKLLGSHIHEHLNWEEKKTLPFHIKKNLVQALVLSKLYYNDIVYYSLPDYMPKRLQRVQKAAAGFVLGRYASTEDILLKLKWLPVKEQREWNLLKTTHKAIHNTNWPNYLKLNIFQHSKCLRSSNGLQLERPLISNTLQDQASHVFNLLPEDVRNCSDFTTFCKKTRNIIYTRALELLN